MDEDNKLLYGLPGDEHLEFDPAAVYEREGWLRDDDEWEHRESKTIPGYMEPMPPKGLSFVIEEWSTTEPGAMLPPAGLVATDVVERYCDEVDEDCYDRWIASAESDEVKAAFQAALDLLASNVNYHMADKLLRTLTVTFDDDGEPLLDGEPMYVKRAEVDQ